MSKRNYTTIQINICLLLLFPLVLSGCGLRKLAAGKFEPPAVEFQGITVYPPDSQYWPLTARLRLRNPNREPLRLKGYDYQVALQGTDLVQGESLDSLTLPGEEETLVEIPVLLRLSGVPPAVQALLWQEKLHYEIRGGFRLAEVLGGWRVPFQFRGEITRQQGLDHLLEFFRKRQ